MPERLTATYIKTLKPKKSRYIITDDKTPGLAVAIYPSGAKYFYYRYKHPGSRNVRSEKLGNAETMTVADARDAAAIAAGQVAKGIDLKEQKEQRLREERGQDVKQELQLFYYIDHYYTPYAKKHSESHEEIISALKSNFEFLQDKPIDQIDKKHIETWRAKRGQEVTFARLQRIFTYLKACINSAVKHYEMIDSFALQNITLKRKKDEKVNAPKVRYLSKDEEQSLISALEKRDQELRDKRSNYVQWQTTRNNKRKKVQKFGTNDYPDHITPIVILAYKTGFDLGDLFDLDWEEHIDFDTNCIRKVRNKTKHKQDNPQPVVVPMSPHVKAILEQWGKQHGMTGRVFVSPRTGGRIDNITKAWNAVKKEADLKDFRFKDFRHTFGSWLAIDGKPLIVIRDLMGHTDIRTTQVYAHLCPTQKGDAIASVFS